MEEQKRRWIDLNLFKTPGYWISAVLSLLIIALYLLSRPEINIIPAPGILEIIEAKTLDLRFLLRGEVQPRDEVVIIAIDEKTEDELGRWQSSGRLWLAKLLDILYTGKAKVIGFDLTLAEPDEGAALKVIGDLRTQYFAEPSGGSPNYSEVVTYLKDADITHNYDRQLTEAIQRVGNVVLGIYHFWDTNAAAHLSPEKQDTYHRRIQRVAYTGIRGSQGSTAQPIELYRSFGFEANLSSFSEAAKSIGHFNVGADRDGYIRFAPLLVEYRDEYYPSLALEVAREYLNPPSSPSGLYTGRKRGWGA